MIEARKLFLRKMTKIGFLHFTNAPTEDTARSLPDIDCPTSEVRSKTVVFFNDKTTLMSNEDQTTQWGTKGDKMMKPKSKGAGIMVSDFIDEHSGFLALSDAEYYQVKTTKPHLRKYAREFLEYGESREGYWTRDKFIKQMKRAIEISEIKYLWCMHFIQYVDCITSCIRCCNVTCVNNEEIVRSRAGEDARRDLC